MAVRSRQGAIGVTLLLGLLGLLVLLWWNQQPSVMPSDVQIEAILRPPGQAENPVPGGDLLWSMEITLNKTTRLPVYSGFEGWSHQVTPFIQGMHGGEWDFMQGLTHGTTGSPVGGDGHSFGMDGIHVPLIEQALISVGMSVTPDRADGFTYLGEEFPTVVRYYFRGEEPTPIESKAWVVYSHQEKRWGRDVSWSKAYPVRLVVADVRSTPLLDGNEAKQP